MLAKTHVSIGFLAALLAKVSMNLLPVVGILLVFNLIRGMLRYLILAGAIVLIIIRPTMAASLMAPLAVLAGSLFPDLDEPNSTGAKMVAPTAMLLRMLLVAAGGILLYIARGNTWYMAAGGILLLVGLLNLKIIPMKKLQRLMLIIAGAYLMAWSPNRYILALGVIYLLMGVLSHRGLTHSVEGLTLAIIGAWFLCSKLSHPELVKPFAIGMTAHYLADMITDHGVYLSYLLKIKLNLPLLTTGSRADKLIGLASMATAILICVGGISALKYFSL